MTSIFCLFLPVSAPIFADDYADGHVHHVTLEGKLLEFFEKCHKSEVKLIDGTNIAIFTESAIKKSRPQNAGSFSSDKQAGGNYTISTSTASVATLSPGCARICLTVPA